MNSRIFFWNVLVRVGLIISTSFVFVWLIESLAFEWLFTLMAGSILIVVQVILLTRYVLKLSKVMEQFIDVVGNEDSPEIRFSTGRTLFRKLEERANTIKEGIQARRLEKEKDDRILISAINSADFGLLCSSSGGEVLFANEAAAGMISFSELKHLDQIRSFNKKIWETLSQLSPGSPRVVRLNPVSGQKDGPVSDRLVSIRLKELKIFDETYRLFSLQDIQEELHKNESDSWQKIIRVLTHEIMNAVAPMLSLTKSLQTRLNTSKEPELGKIADGLAMIESTGKGLVDFTEEYRRLSLLPLPKKERMNLTNAIKGILLLFEKEARDKDIQVSTKFETRSAEIYADPQQFEMVMINLLKNAIESFEEGSKHRRIVIHTELRGNRIVVTVEDTGCGIPIQMLDQVFVPFFSTKEKGSGIGLALSRQILNNHEAFIQLNSRPDEGTRVSLIFSSLL
jgi:nitrogen fixation/metabolism regulation signal transduction histidine kinase